MTRLGWLAAVFVAAAMAQDKRADHPHSAPLLVDSPASHYRFALPAEVYRTSGREDLGDLRVFNAAGEPVPYAFAPRAPQPSAPELRSLQLFPLLGDRDKGVGSADIQVQRTPQGTLIKVSVRDAVPAAKRELMGYLVDASGVKAAQEALVLAWGAREDFSGRVRVEGSDDLKTWRTLSDNSPILSLEHAGARLERNRVEIAGASAKYLRLSFRDVAPDFRLTEVRMELRAERSEPAREWLSLPARAGKALGELEFDTAGYFPVDRIRFVLPQPNTVARVQIYTRARAEQPWRYAASATAYRLAREGGELVSPAVHLSSRAERYWRIQVDQRGGGFGAGEMRLELGWLPHEVLYAARGASPFTVAWGNRRAKPGALPLAAVHPGDEAERAKARLVRLGDISGAAAPAPSPLSQPLKFLRSIPDNREAKKWTLWAVLLVGVLLLGAMALRLLREMTKTPSRNS